MTTAENAQGMNRFWMRERFDLLVLDLMLPGEDGLSICRRLRGGGDKDSDYHADRQGGRYGQDCRTRDGGG